MREILFRGKSVSSGEWVYGGIALSGQHAFIVLAEIQLSEDDSFYFSTTGTEVIPETVGQYTGLKDKNGVEIYDGDILRYYSDARMYLPTKDGGWKLGGDPHVEERTTPEYVEALGAYMVHRGSSFLHEINDKSEVIGNIYEHPHLLEDKA